MVDERRILVKKNKIPLIDDFIDFRDEKNFTINLLHGEILGSQQHNDLSELSAIMIVEIAEMNIRKKNYSSFKEYRKYYRHGLNEMLDSWKEYDGNENIYDFFENRLHRGLGKVYSGNESQNTELFDEIIMSQKLDMLTERAANLIRDIGGLAIKQRDFEANYQKDPYKKYRYCYRGIMLSMLNNWKAYNKEENGEIEDYFNIQIKREYDKRLNYIEETKDKKKKKSVQPVDNNELVEEILISKHLDALTERGGEILITLANHAIKKPSYQKEEDKKDCLQEAMLILFTRWKSFKITKSDNAFAYYTEIFKRAIAQGLKNLYEKDRGRPGNAKMLSIERSNDDKGMFNLI